jgi:WD40 repeat protein
VGHAHRREPRARRARRRINDIAFSPDGSTLLSTANDHTVRLWSTGVGASPPESVPLAPWLDGLTSAVLDADHTPISL